MNTKIINPTKFDIKLSRMIYISITIFVLVFSLIYEYFSHNVFSLYMIGAFVIPLCGMIITEIFYRLGRKNKGTPRIIFQMIAGGVAWLTLGSIFEGVLEIYGTTNQKIVIFWILGFLQVAEAIVVYFLCCSDRR